MPKTLRVAFVCTGNICRSPMAAVMAEKMFADRGMSAVIISGGTMGLRGKPADRHARRAVREIGLDLTSHRCQPAAAGLMAVADHIVVMSPRHTRALVRQDPKVADRIVELWLHDPAGPRDSIEDPVGKDYATFVACRDLIGACLEAWMDGLEA